MASVYSELLASGVALAAGNTLISAALHGTVWIVKDVVAIARGFRYAQMQGFTVQDSNGVAIFAALAPNVAGDVLYHWSGSQVLDPNVTIYADSLDGGWSYRVSGFSLITP